MGLFSKKNKFDSQSLQQKNEDLINVGKETAQNFLKDNNEAPGFSPNAQLSGTETHDTSVFEDFDESHRTHFKPNSYDETKDIADTLIRFKEVTVSFQSVADRSEKRRIIDFLTGVMYGLDGNVKKIDEGIFYFYIKKNN